MPFYPWVTSSCPWGSNFLCDRLSQGLPRGNFHGYVKKNKRITHDSSRGKVYLTIIPRARVGYEMIDSQLGATRLVGYNHLISNKHEWNNCFIKNNQEMLLDHADFTL